MKPTDGSSTSEGNSLICKWGGCEKRWIGQGYCINHYQQARRNGTIQKLDRPHAVSSPDMDTMVGDCSTCGPSVPLLRHANGSPTCRQRAREANAARRRKDPSRWNAYHREYNRAYRFGWTVEEMDAVLDQAGLACEVCTRPLTRKQARLDHDHSCCPRGKGCDSCFRGILCNGCNSAIGLLREDPAIFAAALAYIARNRKAA